VDDLLGPYVAEGLGRALEDGTSPSRVPWRGYGLPRTCFSQSIHGSSNDCKENIMNFTNY